MRTENPWAEGAEVELLKARRELRRLRDAVKTRRYGGDPARALLAADQQIEAATETVERAARRAQPAALRFAHQLARGCERERNALRNAALAQTRRQQLPAHGTTAELLSELYRTPPVPRPAPAPVEVPWGKIMLVVVGLPAQIQCWLIALYLWTLLLSAVFMP